MNDIDGRFALDRRAVARAFGRAGARYDAAARLQAEVRGDEGNTVRCLELLVAPLQWVGMRVLAALPAATDPAGKPYQSVLYAVEYQCRARKWRVLGTSRHPQGMGAGKPVSEEAGAMAFTEAGPGSRAEQLFNHVCE